MRLPRLAQYLPAFSVIDILMINSSSKRILILQTSINISILSYGGKLSSLILQ
jgi:hypothetical protein